jgi:hypothetical protein
MRFALAGFVFVIVLAVGGLAVLATAPLAPPVQKVEQVVPDDQLPR